MNAYRLNIDLRGYWHPGGGRGGGAVLDAMTHRDSTGLPVLPGRHLKGLLREALECAEGFGWDGYAGLAQRLFGARTETAPEGLPGPGSLRVSDGTLPRPNREWLADPERQRRLVPHLYRSLYATAIDTATGTAKDRTLRGIEVVVPLLLQARIEPVPGQPAPPADWPKRLRECLPLIDAVGAQRGRGLGRAVLGLEEDA